MALRVRLGQSSKERPHLPTAQPLETSKVISVPDFINLVEGFGATHSRGSPPAFGDTGARHPTQRVKLGQSNKERPHQPTAHISVLDFINLVEGFGTTPARGSPPALGDTGAGRRAQPV